jgi:predicted acylesterase/phospholipase RssA
VAQTECLTLRLGHRYYNASFELSGNKDIPMKPQFNSQRIRGGFNCECFLSSILPLLFGCLLVQLSSCTTPKRVALPEQYVSKAEIPGMPGVRDWGDRHSDAFQEDFVLSIRQYIDSKPKGYRYEDDTFNVLAISGGGSDGAFAAGLINGWDAAGTRPTFKLVTGISTGSLIAPFAFLGGKYDELIGRLYTSITTNDIFKMRSKFSILWGADSVADSSPLADLIDKYVNEEMLKDVAKAHSEGRRLFIGTTNLDARRLVVWNMGAIASSGRPEALEIFRKVIRASASMPVAFPPMLIEVEADGKTYDEMHVDGGVTVEVFFYGDLVDIDEARRTLGITKKPKGRLFIIRTTQIQPSYEPVKRRLMSIGGKTISSMVEAQGVGDLYRIYAITKRDGIEFNLASIPPEWVPNPKEPFDPDDMKRLYDLGYNMAKSGYPWEKYPPFYHESTITSQVR